MKKFLSLFFLLHITCPLVFGNVCSIPIGEGNEEKMPVLIDNSTSKYHLIIPQEGNVNLDKNEKIILLCPNPRNTLELTHTNMSTISCVKGQTVKILKKNVEFQNISCVHGIRGSAKSTNIRCGDGTGHFIKIGFPVENEFETLIGVCYDSNNGNALFSSHQVIGTEIDYASKSNFRPAFSTAELGPGVSADVAYKKAYEKATFNKLLGSAKLAEKYINNTSFLARGHLSPDADFLFASWQYATYFYVNTVPQWQAVNNGNWKKLEMLTKHTASFYQQNLTIYTGGHEVLELPNVKNQKTKIYLVSNKKLAVPKFLWKILYLKKYKKAIAFIALNNPFVENLNGDDELCENICDEYGWGNNAWTREAKGLVYCCDARDLLGILPTGPKGLSINGILKGPQTLTRMQWFNDDN